MAQLISYTSYIPEHSGSAALFPHFGQTMSPALVPWIEINKGSHFLSGRADWTNDWANDYMCALNPERIQEAFGLSQCVPDDTG